MNTNKGEDVNFLPTYIFLESLFCLVISIFLNFERDYRDKNLFSGYLKKLTLHKK